MNEFKDIVKNGWHPEKDGTTPPKRTTFTSSSTSSSSSPPSTKNEFKDIVRKGWHPEKEGTTLRGQVHASRPLSDLTDPSSFAPPPRRAAAAPSSPPIRAPLPPRRVQPAPSTLYDPRAARNQSFASSSSAATSAAGTTTTTTTAAAAAARDDSSHPPPPPPPYSAVSNASAPPPRLPPRKSSSVVGGGDDAVARANPGYLEGCLNQGATTRLGAAGISVPGLGIGSAASPQPAASPSPSSSLSTPANAEGTTWAQKQSALKTAASFHKDPSSVSMADARSAASTANNFRQRHGEQVKAGWDRASGLNQKYGVTDKLGAFADKHHLSADSSSAAAGGSKKPPPPPPKKKPSLGSFSPTDSGGQDGGAPPIPSSTRPKF
ncbi:hypothetical protein L249_5317 [Ophiocordyceps polyrhachis-furcata BCC 54312]|uniref:Uncharacterized protein n=1 Tax=Ophiocordyceps polyrhachis-furcata BCC 54312 TaxID=1330021 RepID=A0A367L9N9_9HYPO|nr:hypothetical protein L249_5317 [Ophiocordyceps polyrhachis-furcata BCC 54312]